MTAAPRTILIGFGTIAVAFAGLVIYPLFAGIQTESADLVSQRKELAKLEIKIQNFRNFQKSFQAYQPDLEKIEKLLIDPSEPVDLIDFLEKDAARFGLSLEISPLAFKEDDKPWPSLNFRLNLEGAFPDFLKFLERLESAPYLLEVRGLNAFKKEEEPGVEIILFIKVYARKD